MFGIKDTTKKIFTVGDTTYRLTKRIANSEIGGVELIFNKFIPFPIKWVGIGIELSETMIYYRPLLILMSPESRKVVGQSGEHAEMWLKLPKPINNINLDAQVLTRAISEKQSSRLYKILTELSK